jgi:hypothetical protein
MPVILLTVQLFCREGKSFVEYRTFNPAVNSLDLGALPRVRRLYYRDIFPASYERSGLYYRFDPHTGEEYIVSHEPKPPSPKWYWDVNTRTNYWYIHTYLPIRGSLLAGGNKIDIDENGVITGTPAEAWPQDKPVYWDNGHVLLTEKKRSSSTDEKGVYERFRIVDGKTNAVLWSLEGYWKNSGSWNFFETYVRRIGGSWIFVDNAEWVWGRDIKGRITFAYSDTIFNYVSGERRRFAPEIIMGCGDGYVVTTNKEFVGITIRDIENNIVFQDPGFELLGMIRADQGYRFCFAIVDMPYIYYTVDLFGWTYNT